MKQLRHIQTRTGWIARRRTSTASILVAFMFMVAQLQVAAAAIVNDAIATATFAGSPISSPVSSQSVPVVPLVPSLSVTKTGVLNDNDGTPGLSAGDTVSYSVVVENTGGITLTGISASDPLVGLILVSGDVNANNRIDPNETWTYQGNYFIPQAVIDSNGGGDGDIDNTVTISTDQLPDQTASFAVSIDPNVSMVVTKSGVLNDDDGTPGITAGDTISYTIQIENDGLVALTNPVLTDTLSQGVSTTLLPTSFIGGDTNLDTQISPGEIWNYSATYTLTQGNIDNAGNIENEISVTTDQIGPRTDNDTQAISGAVSSYTMIKQAVLVDGDADNLGDAGEQINYTFRFQNTGSRTLANLRPIDPLPGLSSILCAVDFDVDGDIDVLAPGVIADCAASYTILPADLNSGSLNNIATSSATLIDNVTLVIEDDSANDNSTSTLLDGVSGLEIQKTVVSAIEVFPNVVEIQYLITAINSGATALTNIAIEDDLTGAVSTPATLIPGSASVGSFTGFSGTGSLNAGFNGTGDIQLLSGDVQLASGNSGSVTITLRVDTRAQDLDTNNVALGSSLEIPGPIPSDDPDQTPGNPNDNNPTPFSSSDQDNDGSPDTNESPVSDRDGDGIPDAADYDPTGYFYCEDDGRILSGGGITIQNLTAGGSQSGVGSSSNITILQDGNSGFYQFYVTAAGTYRVIPTLPPSTSASTSRLSSGILDVTSLLPSNPAVLGAGETGSTGILSNFSQAANPFFTDFVIEAGDPSVFNNNIPLSSCGIPALSVSKQVISGPTVLPDGSNEISYRITTQNTGPVSLSDITLSDDLAAVFGSGNFTINGNTIETVPAGFGATTNPFYNGDSNVELLTTGGDLQPGESASLLLDIVVDVPDGVYTNTVIAGVSPPSLLAVMVASGASLPVSASIPVTLSRSAVVDGLVVSKSTSFNSARIGSIIPYTITFENTSATAVTGADLVDFMPAGFTYVADSARLNGVPVEPTRGVRELVWSGQNIAAGGNISINLSLAVGAAAGGRQFINSAFIRDPATGEIISNTAKSVVRLEIEAVFQCSDLIGRVFDDLNGDGYYDDGEPGLAGVRVVTVNGLLITTDQFGRYHVTCDQIPDAQIGSNYILKLDTRTLPTGYRVTSENPRVIRVTRGKLSKINFAAANKRLVSLNLSDRSFITDSTSLTKAALNDIAQIFPRLEEAPSLLDIKYRVLKNEVQLQRDRLRSVKSLISKAWKAKKRPFPLEIEVELKR